jgi:regulator of sigma E protease
MLPTDVVLYDEHPSVPGYTIYLEPNLNGAKPGFRGMVSISIMVNKPVSEFSINSVGLSLEHVFVTDSAGQQFTASLREDIENNRIWLCLKRPLRPGIGNITVFYQGNFSAQMHGLHLRNSSNLHSDAESIAITQSQPARLRYWVPSFDAPGLPAYKTRFQLAVSVEASLSVRSNSKILSESLDPKSLRKLVIFTATEKLSTDAFSVTVANSETPSCTSSDTTRRRFRSLNSEAFMNVLRKFHPKSIVHSNNPLLILMLLLISAWLLSLVVGYLAAAAVVGFLIIIHEFGHWAPARMLGLAVNTFSVGFGKVVYKYPGKIWGTTFQLSSVPLGGYILPDDAQLAQSPIWKRALFISGGPTMNLLFAALITCFSYMLVGVPQEFVPTASVVAQLDSKITAAYDSGLRVGDEFVTIDGKSAVSAKEIFTLLQAHQRSPVSVVVKRGSEFLGLTLDHDANGKIGLKGVKESGRTPYLKVGLGTAAADAVKETARQSALTVEWLGKLLHIVPKAEDEQVNADQMQSLIGIVQTGGEFFNSGLISFLTFTAVVSMSLGVLNFLPLPGLDGGQLLFLLIEKIRGEAVSIVIQRWSSLLTIVLFLMATFYAAHNDLIKLIGPMWAAPITVLLICLLVRAFMPYLPGIVLSKRSAEHD